VVSEYPDDDYLPTYVNTWLPSNYRTTGGGPAMPEGMILHTDYVAWFYADATVWSRYIHTFYSILLFCLGNCIGPVTEL